MSIWAKVKDGSGKDMSRVKVKICCIQSEAEVAMAASVGASAVGLVAAMPSGPGPIPDAEIARIAATVEPPLMSVLLTARVSSDGIVDHIRSSGAHAVQLVDRVDPGSVADVKRRCENVTIIEVIHVRGENDVMQARASDADHLLLDSGAPDGATKELGGTGRVHDWDLSARIVAEVAKPVWLAGGLHPGNVAKAIRTVRPYGVDLCSGLRPHGALDPGLLAAFMAEVAGA